MNTKEFNSLLSGIESILLDKKPVITIYSNYDIYYLTNTSLTSESGNINLFSIDRCKLIDSLETLTADDVNKANNY